MKKYQSINALIPYRANCVLTITFKYHQSAIKFKRWLEEEGDIYKDG